MNDDEAVKAFQEMIDKCPYDFEGEHTDGDAFVVKILRDHGFPKLAAAYEARTQDWWYA